MHFMCNSMESHAFVGLDLPRVPHQRLDFPRVCHQELELSRVPHKGMDLPSNTPPDTGSPREPDQGLDLAQVPEIIKMREFKIDDCTLECVLKEKQQVLNVLCVLGSLYLELQKVDVVNFRKSWKKLGGFQKVDVVNFQKSWELFESEVRIKPL